MFPGERYKQPLKAIAKLLDAYEVAVNEAAIVSITDASGRIVYVNDKFITVSGYSFEEAKGKTHRLLNSGYHPAAFFEDMWQTITAGKPWRGQIRNKAKDGTHYWVDTVITPVKDYHGTIVQYLSIRNLITAHKENEASLVEMNKILTAKKQQLKDAQRLAKMGSWYVDLAKNTLEWSEEVYRIFEIPVDTPVTYELFLSFIPEAYKGKVHEAWENAFTTKMYEIEHPIMTQCGMKWVLELASFDVDEMTNEITVLGTVQDITDMHTTREELKRSEMLYRNLFNNNHFAAGLMEKESMRFLEVNDTAVKLYGYSREEFFQLTAYDIRASWEHKELANEVESNNYAMNTSIRQHKKKDGTVMFVEPYISEIIYNDKPAFLISINDVTEKLRTEKELAVATEMRQKEAAKVRLEAQENSRAEIGRELHDNINQLLVASLLYLKKNDAATAQDVISMAMQEIRKLSASLVPPSLRDIGLQDAIRALAENFRLTDTAVTIDISIEESKTDDGHKLNIYRIVQEQFSNIIKHANAKNVKVTLYEEGSVLTLEIVDDGVGFNVSQKDSGIGFSNILYRAEAYNGKLFVESDINKGCTLLVRFYNTV